MRNTLTRKLFRLCGYDVLKVKHSPYANLLGLRNYDIRSILDIGANVGQFARQMRSEFPRAHVYCFEPVPEPFEQLVTQLTDLGLQYSGNLVQYCRDDGHALFVDALFLRDRRSERTRSSPD